MINQISFLWERRIFMTINECIQKIAEEKSMSMYKLAKVSGISQSTISNLYARSSTPSIETLKKIIYALDLSLTDFFMIYEEKRKEDGGYYELSKQYLLLYPEEKECIRKIINLFLNKRLLH